jgi:diguanylate cyclase (GGDEF)-like protein
MLPLALIVYTILIGVVGKFMHNKRCKKFKSIQKELEAKAETDELTGVKNRYALNHFDFDSANITGAFYIDLDRFKAINDTMGHDVGDALLCAVVERVQFLLNPSDHIFRLGGDEFFILVTEPDSLSELEYKANKILLALQSPFLIHDRDLRIDASIGVVDRSAGGKNELLRASDIAMYSAKELGGMIQGWTKELVEQQVRREQIQIELQNVRNRYSSEFELYYQPIVKLKDPTIITNVEALLRWESSNLGWVSPGDFIPIAENSGEISRISYWVLKTAIQQIAAWNQRISISINVSPRDLEQSNFVYNLKKFCELANVEYQYVSLEITERAVTGNMKYYASVIRDLSALNVALKIDDFGTGDSSLKRLLDAPWNTVKIDRSLIPINSSDLARLNVCKAVAALCSDFGIETVAEGIETQEQYKVLLNIGITSGQGYYFARPMPASEMFK